MKILSLENLLLLVHFSNFGVQFLGPFFEFWSPILQNFRKFLGQNLANIFRSKNVYDFSPEFSKDSTSENRL